MPRWAAAAQNPDLRENGLLLVLAGVAAERKSLRGRVFEQPHDRKEHQLCSWPVGPALMHREAVDRRTASIARPSDRKDALQRLLSARKVAPSH